MVKTIAARMSASVFGRQEERVVSGKEAEMEKGGSRESRRG